MIKVVKEKKAKDNATGKIIDIIKVMIIGNPNETIEEVKKKYAEYIPDGLFEKKSGLKNPENNSLPVYTFWTRKNKGK